MTDSHRGQAPTEQRLKVKVQPAALSKLFTQFTKPRPGNATENLPEFLS